MLLIARLLFLAAFLLSAGESAHSGVEEHRRNAEDLRTLQAVGAPTGGPELVRFLLAQVVREGDEQRVAELVRQLASPKFRVRSQAAAELSTRGRAVLPWLRRGLQGADLETRHRLEQCMRTIETRQSLEVGAAAVQRLEFLRPEGASAVPRLLPELCACAAARRFCLARFRGDARTVRRLMAIPVPGDVRRELQKQREDTIRAYVEDTRQWGRETARVTVKLQTLVSGPASRNGLTTAQFELLRASPAATAYVVRVEVQVILHRGGARQMVEHIAVLMDGSRGEVIGIL